MKHALPNAHAPSPMGDVSAADPWVVRLLGAAPSGLHAHALEAAYQRARQLLGADLLDPAQAVLEALLILQPTSARLARALGITYLRQMHAHRARRILAYGLSLATNDPIMRLLHGECVLLCGDRETGLLLLETALSEVPSADPTLHPYIARAQKCVLMAKQGVA